MSGRSLGAWLARICAGSAKAPAHGRDHAALVSGGWPDTQESARPNIVQGHLGKQADESVAIEGVFHGRRRRVSSCFMVIGQSKERDAKIGDRKKSARFLENQGKVETGMRMVAVYANLVAAGLDFKSIGHSNRSLFNTFERGTVLFVAFGAFPLKLDQPRVVKRSEVEVRVVAAIAGLCSPNPA